MKLSILIPTLPESKHYLNRLMNVLQKQITGDVEVITNDLSRSTPTGTKRNLLIDSSKGEYFVQIDCDDLVFDWYVSELLKAIDKNPDVITFNGYMTTDGANKRNFVIKLGEKYEERGGVYYRYPNHLCCFKKSVVAGVRFKPVWVQEDYLWATEIKNKGLLRTSVHIDRDMYHYDFISKKVTTPLEVKRTRLR